MKIALLTDVHHGAGKIHKGDVRRNTNSLVVLTSLLPDIIAERPDALIQLGDLIESHNAHSDEERYRELHELLASLPFPAYSAWGNHEQKFLTNDVREKFSPAWQSFDTNGVRCIILFPIITEEDDHVAGIGTEQLMWLRTQLETDLPCFLFIHYPVADIDVKNNVYFDNNEEAFMLKDRRELRSLLEQHAVIAVFSGHCHQNNHHEINGVHYFTLMSLVDDAGSQETAPTNTYAILTIEKDVFTLSRHGKESITMEYPFKSS